MVVRALLNLPFVIWFASPIGNCCPTSQLQPAQAISEIA